MRIDDYIKKSSKPISSLEITPPQRGKGINEIFHTIDTRLRIAKAELFHLIFFA